MEDYAIKSVYCKSQKDASDIVNYLDGILKEKKRAAHWICVHINKQPHCNEVLCS